MMELEVEEMIILGFDIGSDWCVVNVFFAWNECVVRRQKIMELVLHIDS